MNNTMVMFSPSSSNIPNEYSYLNLSMAGYHNGNGLTLIKSDKSVQFTLLPPMNISKIKFQKEGDSVACTQVIN